MSFEKVRTKLDNIFEEPSFDEGMPFKDLNQKLQQIYDFDDANAVPFALTRAKMLDYTLKNMRIALNEDDRFFYLAERTYLYNRFGTSTIRTIQGTKGEKICSQNCPDSQQKNVELWLSGSSYSAMDTSHVCPDWERILNLGISGLLREAAALHESEPTVFSESVLIAYTALKALAVRAAELAEKKNALHLAQTLRNISENPPATFFEALQLSILYRHAQEIEGEWVRSMGIFDRQYYPFLKNDIARGSLTMEEAEELLCYYFTLFHAESKGRDANVPIAIGGYDKDGSNINNELTFLTLKVFRKLNMPSPKLALRINKDTPAEVLEEAARCVEQNCNSIVFANEDIARKALLKAGKDEDDLYNFVPVGCYEPAIMGKELTCTMSCDFNLAKCAESIFDDPDFDPCDFDMVLKKYFTDTAAALNKALDITCDFEKNWNSINPSPLLSGTFAECMKRSLDVSSYGTKYAPSGVMCAGIGTAVDILMAVKTIVFEKRMTTFHQLGKILLENWQDQEKLRLFAIKKCPKWGCGDPEADALSAKICSFAADIINNKPNAKGGRYQMGLWSIDFALYFGDKMRATADGRFAGNPISKNASASIGCDRNGVAGLINSAGKLDHSDFANGTVIDVMLDKNSMKNDHEGKLVGGLIKTFFKRGGMFIHFNIVSHEELKKAKLDPEKYHNLQIRLCGWNVRFIDLAEEHQDNLIREAESKTS